MLAGSFVFLSASIPDPARWRGEFNPLEITDAVVAVGRTVLSAGAQLVTAAHPTIAPLLLYVAAELPPSNEPRVLVYQSTAFEAILPEATRRFEADGVGRLVRIEGEVGEPPDPAHAPLSLARMRRRMLAETAPLGGIFIGGMSGVLEEASLFAQLRPRSPSYPIGYPGGEARSLASESTSALGPLLTEGTVYPAIARAIVEDLVQAR